MALDPFNAAIPNAPFIDPGTDDIAVVWRQFLVALWNRTGRGPGLDSANPTLQAQLNAETQQRQTADTSLGNAISAETARAITAENALGTALNTEILTRTSEDIRLTGLAGNVLAEANAAVAAETAARKAADLLLVPIAQLCAMWAQCNLNFLPTADPGHGMPWLSGTTLTVGSPATGIGLEDVSGHWGLENLVTDRWLYG
jgi:hypothetical protein